MDRGRGWRTDTLDCIRVVKIVIGILIVVAIIVAVRMLPVAQWLTQFQAYVRGAGAIGYIVYAIVYAICVVLFVPATILTLGAGAIFGLAGGTLVVIAGATLGATLAFLLARTILRARIEKMTEHNPKFRALDQAIAREGTKIVFLVRLSVLFPFTWINYAFGLTGVRLGTYVWTTFLGIAPATFAFVYIGSIAHEATTASRARLVVYVLGAVAALAVSIVIGRIATKAIRSPLSEGDHEQSTM
jgi:uncharacterized membrane protein YdjX (TVP38/TMEM64 family)